MKNYPSLVMGFVMIMTILALPADAAVIDQVKDKVNAIKNETASIKNKVVNIGSKLDPLTKLQDKFAEFGFDPSEFLDMIPAEDIQNMMESLREKQAEAQARINDPNLETFRYDFLETLAGIRNILAVDEFDNMPSPLETLVQNAPLPVLGIIKAATEPFFERLRTNVTEASATLSQLRSAGLFDLMDAAAYPHLNPGLGTSMHTPVSQLTTDEKNERYCKAAGNIRPFKLVIWRQKVAYTNIAHYLEGIYEFTEGTGKEMKIKVGIHGYFGKEFTPGDGVVGMIKGTKLNIDHLVTNLDYVLEILDFAHDFEGCSLWVDWRDHEQST